jgi:hypothetical protein
VLWALAHQTHFGHALVRHSGRHSLCRRRHPCACTAPHPPRDMQDSRLAPKIISRDEPTARAARRLWCAARRHTTRAPASRPRPALLLLLEKHSFVLCSGALAAHISRFPDGYNLDSQATHPAVIWAECATVAHRRPPIRNIYTCRQTILTWAMSCSPVGSPWRADHMSSHLSSRVRHLPPSHATNHHPQIPRSRHFCAVCESRPRPALSPLSTVLGVVGTAQGAHPLGSSGNMLTAVEASLSYVSAN